MYMPMNLLRRRDVSAMTGLPRSTLYAAVKAGTFPKSVAIGKRSVAWRSDEIEAWISQRRGRDNLGGASGQ